MKRMIGVILSTTTLMSMTAAHAGEINWWVSEPGYDKAQELVAAFEAANPDITVKLQSNPYGGLEGKVMIALRSGNPPDLIEVQTSWVPSYITTDTLAPMQEAIEATTPLTDFIEAPIASASLDGNLYALPFQAESIAMLYRKDFFREAGLDPEKPPRTWAEMIEASKALTDPSATPPRYGYGIAGGGPEGQGNTLYRSLPYLWMNGGGILSEDGTEVIINSPESVEGIKFYTDMYTALQVAPPSTLENDSQQLRRLFMSGAIAMYQGTPTEIDRFAESAPDLDYGVGILPYPEGKATSALLGGWAFIMPSAGPNPEDTKKLVSFLASAENVGAYTRTFPTINAALDLPRFADPRLDAFKEMLQNGRPQPPVAEWLEISAIYYRYVQEILLGEDAQSAMDSAAEEIQALLDRG